jgi:hypothetical protein
MIDSFPFQLGLSNCQIINKSNTPTASTHTAGAYANRKFLFLGFADCNWFENQHSGTA